MSTTELVFFKEGQTLNDLDATYKTAKNIGLVIFDHGSGRYGLVNNGGATPIQVLPENCEGPVRVALFLSEAEARAYNMGFKAGSADENLSSAYAMCNLGVWAVIANVDFQDYADMVEFGDIEDGAILVDLDALGEGGLPNNPINQGSRFTLNATGDEVNDTQTGLIWKRCFEGQVWDGQTPQGEPTKFTWDEAVAYAAAQSVGWHLPTVEEFRAIFVGEKPDEDLFPGKGWSWTSSTHPHGSGDAWDANYQLGCNASSVKGGRFSVRLVRSQ